VRRVRRGDPKDTGALIRLAIEPMADHLGVGYDESFDAPTVTNEERVVYALRCGLSLIMDYAYPDQWALASQSVLSKRDCRRVAQHVQDALGQREGHEAVACAAEGYGRAIADLWRRAADPTTRTGAENAAGIPDEDRPGLLVNAATSESLADLVAEVFAPPDPHGVLKEIEGAEAHRFYDPASEDAMMDLRDCAARATVTGRAVALALGARFHDYSVAIVGPVMHMNLALDAAVHANWAVVGEYWANALQPEPRPYGEMVSVVRASHGA
jgi:hypothetical protein